MILRAADLALQMKLYSRFMMFVLRNKEAPRWDERVALNRRMRETVLGNLMGSSTRAVDWAIMLAGEDANSWPSLLEAMRAAEQGRPMGGSS